MNIAAAKLTKQAGVTVVLNPAPSRPICDELAALLEVVTPNEQELAAVKNLRLPLCITTLGAKGCRINHTVTIPALPVEAVDTTGAGDTFNGVLAACLAEGKEIEEACRVAVAAAGLSVTKRGVLQAIPHREDIERMIRHG